MTTSTKPSRTLPDHGTLSRRKYHGCRCQPCRDAYNAYQRTRSRRLGYGTWKPLVDAEPVRRHLLALKDSGYSTEVMAKAVGRYVATLNAIIYPINGVVRQRVRTDLAEAILVLTPETLTPGLLPVVGSARRLRALVAQGWTTGRIAEWLGVRQPRVSEISRQAMVTPAVARQVAACYEALRVLVPEEHGVAPVTALRSRRMAERKGWRDPLWWEDWGGIDDPEFDPAAVDRPLNFHEQAKANAEEMLHLAACGVSEGEIAERLGLCRDYVVLRLRGLREAS